MPPDLDAGLCRKFSPAELDSTFNFSATSIRSAPKGAAKEAWEEAKEVCIECPVFLRCRAQCWGQEHGVVGGTDEHERYLYRRRLTRELAVKAADERAKLAEHFHTRYAGGLGDAPELIARTTGYSGPSIRAMIQEHQDLLDAKREQRSGVARDVADWEDVPVFPAGSPQHGDGWVWYFGQALKGHYMAETADGAFVHMKFKTHRAQTTKWLPASHVDLRTRVVPVVQDWAGRPDGIQEEAQDDQRPGQQAADAA